MIPESSGIYIITCSDNKKSYIGQSYNIADRIHMHIYLLRKNMHYNNHMQRSWNKYGEQTFTFGVLECCSVEELNEKEIFYISEFDTYNKGFNQTLGGDGMRGYKVSEASRVKMRESHYDCIGANNPHSKRIVLINTGEVFNCIRDASEKYSVCHADISKNAKRKSKYAGVNNGVRLVWAYEEDYIKFSIEQIEELLHVAQNCRRGKMCNRSKRVICLDTCEIFYTIFDASEKHGVSRSCIGAACSGVQKHAGRDKVTSKPLTWMYLEDYLCSKANIDNTCCIDMVS